MPGNVTAQMGQMTMSAPPMVGMMNTHGGAMPGYVPGYPAPHAMGMFHTAPPHAGSPHGFSPRPWSRNRIQ